MADREGWGPDLRFDRPAAIDGTLVFGADFVAPRNDLALLATLPGLTVQIRCIPPVRVELRAELPPLTGGVWLRPSVPVQLGTATLPGPGRYLITVEVPSGSGPAWADARTVVVR